MVGRSRDALTRALAGVLSGLLVVGGLALAAPTAAQADSAPAKPGPTDPATVTTDALPTAQVNGVVWSQAVVGTTVYAAGSFTTVRPAGAAPGTQETVRNNLLAFDIRTGELISSFAPDLNAQAMVVAASPDGSRIYVGGDFTVANGQPRSRIAAYDTRTGALVPNFAPAANSQVRAIAATNSTVYFGGLLTAVGSVSRTRLAAVRASDGGLLPWAPTPGIGPTGLPYNRDGNRETSNAAMALVVTGGGSQVVAAGRWDTMSGVRATAITALDPNTGANRGYAVNTILTNQGVNSAVYGLATDGTNVYGTAYDFYGPGNLEGSFSVRAGDGAINWVNTCYGDSYASFPMNGALYQAGHPHHCSEINAFPEQVPRINEFATAVSLAPASSSGGAKRLYQGPWRGVPAPALLAWFPDLAPGTYTKQNQAAWAVAGNGQYLVVGGEFPRVNGVGQQGLVRFATSATAPNKRGPEADAGLTPAVSSTDVGAVRVAWRATSDPDNRTLTYRVTRSDRPDAPVFQTTATSTWWDTPALGFVDRDVTPGAQYTYRVSASDSFGNAVSGAPVTVTVASVAPAGSSYAATVRADSPEHYWRMEESASGRAADQNGFEDLVFGPGVGTHASGALGGGNAGRSMAFDGTERGTGAIATRSMAPTTTSMEAWFSTTSTRGGVLMDFSDVEAGLNTGDHDRMVALDDAGRLNFSVYPGSPTTITSPRTYNDGAWHHVVATHGAAGLALYVDGALVASNKDVRTGQATLGMWRVGGDGRWVGSSDWFNGRLDEVAVYGSQLTAAQVQRHHTVGRTGVGTNTAPTASFTSTVTGLTAALDGRASSDREGTINRYSWSFGDGTTATGATVEHAYARAGTYRVRLTVTDNNGSTATAERDVTVAAVEANRAPEASFTSAVSGLAVSVDGAGSTDADGSVKTYAWEFGDGSTGTGVTASRTYAAAGTYSVKLTVTDDRGATASTTRSVTVTGPTGPVPLATDSFERTVASGFGDAEVGGAWTTAGPAGTVSVSGGRGQLSMPAARASTGAVLNGVQARDVAVQVALSMPERATGGGTYAYVTARRVGGTSNYRAAVRFQEDGTTTLAITRVLSGTETSLGLVTLPGTLQTGQQLLVRFAVSGADTALLQAKAWAAGTPEPAEWTLSRTDGSEALRVAGAVGVTTYLAGSATAPARVQVDDLRITDPKAAQPPAEEEPPPPVNQVPVASFTSAVSGLAVSVDGAGSTDADGSVTSYAWEFGDGSTGTGVTASRTYAAAGTYPVKLTVTDDRGATASTTRSVTVTAPAGPVPVVVDSFERSVASGFGQAEVGGAWTTAGPAGTVSVSGGRGLLSMPAARASTGAVLNGVQVRDTAVQLALSMPERATGGGTYVYVEARRTGGNNSYRAVVRFQADGTASLGISRVVSGAETSLGLVTLPGTLQPGQQLLVRFDVSGADTALLQAKAWAAGAPEPAEWTLSRTDTAAALRAAGGIGITTYLGGSATGPARVQVDDVWAGPAGTQRP